MANRLQNPGWVGVVLPLILAIGSTFTPSVVRAFLLIAAIVSATWVFHKTDLAAKDYRKTGSAFVVFVVLAVLVFLLGRRLDTVPQKTAPTTTAQPSSPEKKPDESQSAKKKPRPTEQSPSTYKYRNEMTVQQSSKLSEQLAGVIRQAQPIVFVITSPTESEEFRKDIYALVVDACNRAGNSPCSIEHAPDPKLEIDTGIPSPTHSGIVVHTSDSTASAARQYLAQYVLGTCYKTLYSSAMPDVITKLNGPRGSNFVWLELGPGSPWNSSGAC